MIWSNNDDSNLAGTEEDHECDEEKAAAGVEDGGGETDGDGVGDAAAGHDLQVALLAQVGPVGSSATSNVFFLHVEKSHYSLYE